MQQLSFRLSGQLTSEEFHPWMVGHAEKLGVRFDIEESQQGQISIRAFGSEEMTKAFALACSLGPQSVLVEQLEILEP